MNKEKKIGLAVIGFLTATLAAVVAWRVLHERSVMPPSFAQRQEQASPGTSDAPTTADRQPSRLMNRTFQNDSPTRLTAEPAKKEQWYTDTAPSAPSQATPAVAADLADPFAARQASDTSTTMPVTVEPNPLPTATTAQTTPAANQVTSDPLAQVAVPLATAASVAAAETVLQPATEVVQLAPQPPASAPALNAPESSAPLFTAAPNPTTSFSGPVLPTQGHSTQTSTVATAHQEPTASHSSPQYGHYHWPAHAPAGTSTTSSSQPAATHDQFNTHSTYPTNPSHTYQQPMGSHQPPTTPQAGPYGSTPADMHAQSYGVHGQQQPAPMHSTAGQPQGYGMHQPQHALGPELPRKPNYDIYGRDISAEPDPPVARGFESQPQQPYHYSSQTGIPDMGREDANGRYVHHHLAGQPYTVRPNDSYWTISETVYGSGNYFKALEEHNRQRMGDGKQLRVGNQIVAPSVEVLEQQYPDLVPKRRALPPQSVTLPVSVHTDPNRGGRIYKVREGDTLFDIARYELGKASRWAEIYELNRDRLGSDFDFLKPGTELLLPNNQTTERPPLTTRRSTGNMQR